MNKLLARFWADRTWNLSIIALGLLSGFMYLFNLANGLRSEYYASIAVSMSKSFSNFFFGALDGAGNLTLDKIPGSYWVPAIFVKLFGMSTWSVNAPNALASVGLVIVVALTAKRLFGNTIGIVAGALIATTPIIAAVARSNQPESFFVLMLALAANQAVAAFQNNDRRALVIAGAWIAAAFQMYMIEAWAVWPALILAWLFTKQTREKKFKDLAIAGSISLGLSLIWIIIVSLIPASNRPYIGGTYHNNAWEMVFGYNALGRFAASSATNGNTISGLDYRSFTPPFGGDAGLGRLFNVEVAGQISWLIPATVVAIILLFRLKQQRVITLFLTTWFVTFYLMLSLVAGIHQFYVSSLAIPMALLIAMAIGASVKAKKYWQMLLLAAPTVIWTVGIAKYYQGYFNNLPYIQVALLFVPLALVLFLGEQFSKLWLRVTLIATTVLSMALTPLVWSMDAMNHPSTINPVAGPAEVQIAGPGGFGQVDNSTLIKYLRANRGKAKYLLVTFGAQNAASFTTATGDNILPVGGFNGQDPAPTLAQFEKMQAAGEIKFVLIQDQGENGGPMGGHDTSAGGSAIQNWVASNCATDSNGPANTTLYVCGAK